MTSYPDFLAGATTSLAPASLAPAGCPAHGAALSVAEIDTHPDPREMYHKARAEYGGVVPVTLDGVFAWLVIGYQEAKTVMRQDVLYSRSSQHWRPRAPIPGDWSLALHTQERPNALFATGERHTRLRGALTRSLGRTRLGTVRRYTRDRGNRLIDQFCETGRANLVADYAAQLPLMVLMRIFGLSEQAAQQLVTALPALLDGGEEAQRANQQIMDILEAHIAYRRQELGADAIAWLIEEDGARTEEEIARSNTEIREQVWLTLASAMGAMGNWISNGLERQVSDARMRDDLNHGLADIQGSMRATLWEQPPLQRVIGRWSTRSTPLGGTDVAAGDMLVLDLAAVNLDPCMGSAADRADSEANMSFGAGPHECPFPDLAQAIAEVSVDLLLQRLPDVRLADEATLRRRPSVIVNALESLPVQFTPTARSASEDPLDA
ncbi:hypothetical protein ACFQ7F_16335 [Streptomyces sp. NPDC056486]|uniref:hypothetical protein n=1 Tax=Streptomyces sp. NPDC056486 TaxID=3345835 RepID=UPI0036B579BC